MKIDVLTIFPEALEAFFNSSIIKRAKENNKVEINLINFRDFSKCKHKKVDDYQFGGGAGMVLMPEPIYLAVESVRTNDSKVILMTPQGRVLNQKIAYEFAEYKHLIIICGHYEGLDERILDIVDYEVSIGDYILTGGEAAAMVFVDSIVRLIPNVINEESISTESFENNLLDYPVYTKPREFRNKCVPEILFSGHHKNIEKWRLEQRLIKTKEKRPDLLKKE